MNCSGHGSIHTDGDLDCCTHWLAEQSGDMNSNPNLRLTHKLVSFIDITHQVMSYLLQHPSCLESSITIKGFARPLPIHY